MATNTKTEALGCAIVCGIVALVNAIAWGLLAGVCWSVLRMMGSF